MVEFYDEFAKENISYHIDKKLKDKWDRIKSGKLIDLNEDRVYIIDGRERSGKSSFAFQQAKYLDPKFDISQICLTPESFLYQIKNAERGKVIVFDEAFRGLSSKSTRSKVNKAIVEALMEVGQRNLCIFIVLPTIFLLEIYAAVFRSECLFHVYKMKSKSSSGKRLRAFKIYNYEKKKVLYLRGKRKHFSYAYPKIRRAKGRFFVHKTKEYPTGIPYNTFQMDEYVKKKQKAFSEKKKEDELGENTKYKIQRNALIRLLHKYETLVQIAEGLEKVGAPISKSQIGLIAKETGKYGLIPNS